MAYSTFRLLVSLVAVVVLVVMAEATPPGIVKNPSHATCKDKKYKDCNNLVHVCPKFCPDQCYVECASCKPICGVDPNPPPKDDPTPTIPSPPSETYYSPPPPVAITPSPPASTHIPPHSPPTHVTPSPSPPPPSSPPPPYTETPSTPPPPTVETPSLPSSTPTPPHSPPTPITHLPSPPPPSSPPPPYTETPRSPPPPVTVTPSPSTSSSSPPHSPLTPVTPPPSPPPPPSSPPPPYTETPNTSPPPAAEIPSPSTSTPTPPHSSPTPVTPSASTPSPSSPPPPYTETPSTPPTISSPPLVTSTPPPTTTPANPNPPSPPPISPNPPSTPPANPNPPSAPSAPSTPNSPSPPGPSLPPPTPSETPSSPSTNIPPPASPSQPPPTGVSGQPPPPSPPSSSAGASKRVRCKNVKYPQCYNMIHTCPSACPNGCQVDCVTCKPVCHCDRPGAVCQDPRFIGGDGITFYFHGKKDRHFCLVSDPNLHINAHFIGKRNPSLRRDFTWVQSLGILFQTHRLLIAAQKTAVWDDSTDRLNISFDGRPVALPEFEGSRWQHRARNPTVVAVRLSTTNHVMVEAKGLFRIMAKVVPITKEDSRIHSYGMDDGDSLAHLDVGFKFFGLSGEVNGVLGQTYGSEYVSNVNVKAAMTVMGKEEQFETSSLFAPDCAVARFGGGDEVA